MKLNLGCGKRIIPGYLNCDIQQLPGCEPPDLLCDFRSVPLEDGCADEILAIHIFEHVYKWETDALLEEWKRLLKREGKLILEMPDLIKCCRNLLEGVTSSKHPEQMSYWGIYGDATLMDPYMIHRWGWHPGTLRLLLESHGFVEVVEMPPQFHKQKRDFRMEAYKP